MLLEEDCGVLVVVEELEEEGGYVCWCWGWGCLFVVDCLGVVVGLVDFVVV